MMFKKSKSISDEQFSPKAKKSMLKKFVNKKTGIVAGATIAATSVATYSMRADMPQKTELYGQHYQMVVEKLEERGFTNIEMEPLNDLEYGQVDKSEVVELVKVNDDEWKDGKTWKSDTITVFYHTSIDDAVIPDINMDSTYSETESRLKSDGFNDITITPILLLEEGNESKKDKVDIISIGDYDYNKDYFYSNKLPVKITYFDVSPDNIKIPINISLEGNKDEIEKSFKESGFTDITLESVADKNKNQHNKIKTILLGDASLETIAKDDLIVKKSTPVKISFYDFSSFAELPAKLEAKTNAEAKKLFTEGGFVNISEKSKETKDISKNGQIESIRIDDKSFNKLAGKAIKKDSKIVITYWNAEKAIAEEAKKAEEAKRAEEARLAEETRKANEAHQAQIQQFAAAPTPSAPVASNTYYPNCTAVRNAGAAPIYAGQPGYGRHLDRDGDGRACE